ncbi:hypothetical protein FEM48_Zijuj01G0231100 [Ziziphus jujuba var. spinosa]|uniref:FAS1 domain-containing protein n=1 Tax=Ziziphus jujuba var. spinosa TaxID=714518 RepID=A0A978W432_ZIZJJ|nr:hypothetical protein FEM48_Zijuj01G0231100 [Ziziphus jujuba var. spinosa]
MLESDSLMAIAGSRGIQICLLHSRFGLLLIQFEGNINNFSLAMALKTLSHKGYQAMSMIYDVFIKTHDVSKWLTETFIGISRGIQICLLHSRFGLLLIQFEGNINNFSLAMALKTLSHKGYQAMSMIYDVFIKTHFVSKWLTGNSILTVFSPPDRAFFSSKYFKPPLALLQYHVVPLKLDIEALTPLPHGGYSAS